MFIYICKCALLALVKAWALQKALCALWQTLPTSLSISPHLLCCDTRNDPCCHAMLVSPADTQGSWSSQADMAVAHQGVNNGLVQCAGCFVLCLHQLALSWGMIDIIHADQRGPQLWHLNKEGLLSVPGYWALSLLSTGLTTYLHPQLQTAPGRRVSGRCGSQASFSGHAMYCEATDLQGIQSRLLA